MPYEFQDIHEAQACLVDLARWLLVIGTHIDREHESGNTPEMAKYQTEKVRCGNQLQRWEHQFDDVVNRSESPSELVLLHLRLWHTFAILLVKAESYGPEMRYDAFMTDFEGIISCAEKMAKTLQSSAQPRMYSFEIGYLIPLHFAATRCRDPVMRRRAIAVMRNYWRQEGLFLSVAAAAVATGWMDAEEEGLDAQFAADIPEERRLNSIDLRADIDNGNAALTLCYRSVHGELYRGRDVIVSWYDDYGSKLHALRSSSRSAYL